MYEIFQLVLLKFVAKYVTKKKKIDGAGIL